MVYRKDGIDYIDEDHSKLVDTLLAVHDKYESKKIKASLTKYIFYLRTATDTNEIQKILNKMKGSKSYLRELRDPILQYEARSNKELEFYNKFKDAKTKLLENLQKAAKEHSGKIEFKRELKFDKYIMEINYATPDNIETTLKKLAKLKDKKVNEFISEYRSAVNPVKTQEETQPPIATPQRSSISASTSSSLSTSTFSVTPSSSGSGRPPSVLTSFTTTHSPPAQTTQASVITQKLDEMQKMAMDKDMDALLDELIKIQQIRANQNLTTDEKLRAMIPILNAISRIEDLPASIKKDTQILKEEVLVNVGVIQRLSEMMVVAKNPTERDNYKLMGEIYDQLKAAKDIFERRDISTDEKITQIIPILKEIDKSQNLPGFIKEEIKRLLEHSNIKPIKEALEQKSPEEESKARSALKGKKK
ncbi:MAG: hypothetical protein ACHQJ6_08975 [Candidatus Berkiellales bacterium]